MRKINQFILLLLVCFLISCGKKTEPVSKDSFIISPVNTSEVLFLGESGVILKNHSKKYNLLVEKAVFTDNCTGDFKVVADINPEGTFVDQNVAIGKEYIYGFYHVDNYLKFSSVRSTKKVVYSRPVKVTDFIYDIGDADTLRGNVTFSDAVNFFKISLNGKEIDIKRQNSFEILLENRDKNIIEIIPFDNYLNKGITFSQEIINKRKFFLVPPSDFNVIKTAEKYLLSWDKIDGAKGYRVYYDDKNITTSESYAFISLSVCNVYVSSFNEVFESDKAEVNLCH